MIQEFDGKEPEIHETAYVHPSATIIGDVEIGARSSVWPGAVIRGDLARVEIGRYTCVQDNAVVHTDYGKFGNEGEFPMVELGDYVVVGHQALIHGAKIHDECLIGAGSTVFNRAVIHEHALVGLGAVVLEDTEVPPRKVVVGIPSRELREIDEENLDKFRQSAEDYADLAARYKDQL
ncbi:MAG: gamma carbonic anhydrase family protein [Candidatus Hadarchaeia archaeon]